MDYFKKVLPKSLIKEKILIKKTQSCCIYNEKDNTRIEFTDMKLGKNAIRRLKTFKHPNVINVIKYETEKNRIYIKTKKMHPFLSDVQIKCDPIKDFIFRYHALNVVGNVIIFLKSCKLCHNKIGYDSFFIDEDGKIVLGVFEECREEGNSRDEHMFLEMVNDLKKQAKSLKKNFEYKKIISHDLYLSQIKKVEGDQKASKLINDVSSLIDGLNATISPNEIIESINQNKYNNVDNFISLNKEINKNSIYTKFENVLRYFHLFELIKKEIFLDFITINASFWIDSITDKIFNMYIAELSIENKNYKEKILDLFFKPEFTSNLDNRVERLFELPDSQVRFYLLTKVMYNNSPIIEKVKNWDGKIFENIILGVKCSDKNLKKESIKLLNVIFLRISNKNKKETIKTIYKYIKGNTQTFESSKLINNNISIFLEEKRGSGLMEHTYNLITMFLLNDIARKDALDIFLKLYKKFDIKKLQLEILPLLIKYLGDKENQEKVFKVIDGILDFLRCKKNELIDSEWSVLGLTNVFNKIQLPFGKNKNDVIKKEASLSDKKIKDESIDANKEEKMQNKSLENDWEDEDW